VELTDDDVREILRIVAETPLAELSIETAGFTLYVRRGDASAPAAASPPAAAETNGLVTIEAPMLGTFYRAEGPGRAPFVEVGATVEPDTTVCIIEVMKMMNSIPAGVAGTIEEVCEENAQLVEYGQPLFRVRPA
jgi:acetyl-CoA carboxylase biotin carboxyl carrier protein